MADENNVSDDECAEEIEAGESESEEAEKTKVDRKEKKRKTGIIYLSTIPSGMTVPSIRQFFSTYGEVGQIYLQPDEKGAKKAKKGEILKHVKFIEGWVEFKRKKIAKRVALSLNNTMVGGKRHSQCYYHLWSIKYLHRFKWIHLNERLAYERAARSQRMRTEIAQVKRETNFYIHSVETNRKMKKLRSQNDERVAPMNIRQKETDQEIRARKTGSKRSSLANNEGPDQELLRSIFASGDS